MAGTCSNNNDNNNNLSTNAKIKQTKIAARKRRTQAARITTLFPAKDTRRWRKKRTEKRENGCDVFARSMLTVLSAVHNIISAQVHIIMMFGTNFRQATVMMLHLLRISFIKITRRRKNQIVSSVSSVSSSLFVGLRCAPNSVAHSIDFFFFTHSPRIYLNMRICLGIGCMSNSLSF